MGNLAGVRAVLAALVRPRLILPTLEVSDVRALDWTRFRQRGINGVVIDKDNCITKPLRDELVPELKESWARCVATFGPQRVLVVSNSAGTVDDPNLIQAESVSRSLGVPVLLHSSKKPAVKCAVDVARYFSPRPAFASFAPVPVVFARRSEQVADAIGNKGDYSGAGDGEGPRLLVVGDRLTTDVILASRIRGRLAPDSAKRRRLGILPSLIGRGRPISATAATEGKGVRADREGRAEVVSVLTTRVWERERAGTSLMRWMEGRALKAVRRWEEKRKGVQGLRREGEGWEDCIVRSARPAVPRLEIVSSPAVIVARPWHSGIPARASSLLDRVRNFHLPSLPPRSTILPTILRILSRSTHHLLAFATFAGRRLVVLLTPWVHKVEQDARRWYAGSMGLGFKIPELWRHLGAWKRIGGR